MIEIMLIALLVWLWVIERRLHALNDVVRTLKLDVDGLRALRRSAQKSEGDVASSTPPLPEVTSMGRSNPKSATGKAAVH